MTLKTLPVFDASSEFHQNIGLLKVAEMAMRKHGDAVMIRASEVRSMVLLCSTDAIRYWKGHQGHFQTEMGAIASNAAITRILLGDALDQPENAMHWDATRKALARVNANWVAWSEHALISATQKLLADIDQAGTSVDLRGLCSIWSVRALVPTLFGATLTDEEMRSGLMQIEQFYFAMSTLDADETRDPLALQEFQIARAFLDRATEAAIGTYSPGDETVIAAVLDVLPQDLPLVQKIDCLRPTLGRLLLEKLNIDGLALLWGLMHVAQDAVLQSEITAEMAGRDPFGTPDADTPLGFSVVQECLRMYPELPFIYRITSQPVEVLGYEIPKETTVVFSPWLTHRDARYWQTPNAFDGRRFVTPPSDKSAYLPFGIGPRVKARTTFLQHQLSVAIRAVVQSYAIAVAPDAKRGNMRPILRSTLAPRGAVSVSFAPRGKTADIGHAISAN